jgi:hypothetical protein
MPRLAIKWSIVYRLLVKNSKTSDFSRALCPPAVFNNWAVLTPPASVALLVFHFRQVGYRAIVPGFTLPLKTNPV